MKGVSMVGWSEAQRRRADDGERVAHGLLWALPCVLVAWVAVVCGVAWLVVR
jgi:hypothetical protein